MELPIQVNSSPIFNMARVGYRLAMHVALVGLRFDQAQILAQLEPSFSKFGHLDKLEPRTCVIARWLRSRIVSDDLMLFVRPGSLFLFCNLARVGFSCEYSGGCSDQFSRERRSARQVTIFSVYSLLGGAQADREVPDRFFKQV